MSVKVDELPDVTEVGLNDADAPAGKPLTVNATDCATPDVTAVLIVEVPLAPWVTDTVEGDAAIEKSFVTVPPQPANLNEPIRVLQLKAPFVGMYSVVNQNVQSSVGSTDIIE